MHENFSSLAQGITKVKGNVVAVLSNGCLQYGEHIQMGVSNVPHLKVGDQSILLKFHDTAKDLLALSVPIMNDALIFKREKTNHRFILRSVDGDLTIVQNTGILRYISTTSNPVTISREEKVICLSSFTNPFHSDYLFLFELNASCHIQHENSSLFVRFKNEFILEKEK